MDDESLALKQRLLWGELHKIEISMGPAVLSGKRTGLTEAPEFERARVPFWTITRLDSSNTDVK